MQHLKVIITEPIDSAGLRILSDAVNLQYLPDTPSVQLADAIQDASAVGVRLVRITPELMDRAPQLKVVAKHGVGLDNIDIRAATRRHIIVTTTPRANSVSVAEHIVSFMLCLANRICAADGALRSGTLRTREDYVGVELRGKTLGIVGLGRIGSETARKCRAGFDMDVVAYDPFLPDAAFQAVGCERTLTLGDLLSRADFVALCAPLTEWTRGMIGARQLALMKPTAYLINTARGGLVDEAALYATLKDRKLAGAAIDAFVEEPPPCSHPLLSLDNVIATPHTGGATREAMRRMATDLAEEILRVLRGERARYPVNPEAYR